MKHLPALRWTAALAAAFLAGWLVPRGPSRSSAAAPHATSLKESPQATASPGPAGSAPEAAGAPGAPLPAGEAALRAHVREALAEGRTFDRISRITAILGGMTRGNASVIQGEIESAIKSGRRLLTEQLLLQNRLGQVMGREAVEALRPEDPEREPPARFSDIMSGWAGAEPEAAMTWFNGLPDGKFRDEALPWVINGLCAENLDRGLRIFSDLPAEMQLGAANQMFWNFVQARGPEGTEPWVAGLLEAARAENAVPEQVQLAQRMLNDLTTRWLHDSPEAAAAFLSRQGHLAADSQEAVNTVLGRWMKKDPEAARKWAEDFAAGSAPSPSPAPER